jgi:hypothetical protein
MAEFLKWAIKQSTTGQMASSPIHVDSLLRRLFSLIRHPSPFRRAAAALAFNSFYRSFREEDALVQRYALDILQAILQMLKYVLMGWLRNHQFRWDVGLFSPFAGCQIAIRQLWEPRSLQRQLCTTCCVLWTGKHRCFSKTVTLLIPPASTVLFPGCLSKWERQKHSSVASVCSCSCHCASTL